MAGIGFELRHLLRKNTLTSVLPPEVATYRVLPSAVLMRSMWLSVVPAAPAYQSFTVTWSVVPSTLMRRSWPVLLNHRLSCRASVKLSVSTLPCAMA